MLNPMKTAHEVPIRPEVTFSSSSARGASVLGCSLDVAWALKDAAKDAAAYPVDGRPKTYQVEGAAFGESKQTKQ